MEASLESPPGKVGTNEFNRLLELISRSKVAMLTTVDATGGLRSRPLHCVDVSNDGVISFVVSTVSPGSQEIIAHGGKLNLSYANHVDSEYVSITGTGHLTSDTSRKAAVWNKTIELWFPNGENDSSVTILEVRPDKAEFWDGPSNFLTRAYAYAKAASTGNKDAYGENSKLELR